MRASHPFKGSGWTCECEVIIELFCWINITIKRKNQTSLRIFLELKISKILEVYNHCPFQINPFFFHSWNFLKLSISIKISTSRFRTKNKYGIFVKTNGEKRDEMSQNRWISFPVPFLFQKIVTCFFLEMSQFSD